MLSILIPTYNYNITALVRTLHFQAVEQLIDFEIIVMEDGSGLHVEANKTIEKLDNCKHIILDNNIGRSAIRNRLADTALYNHLLFMDCDAKVFSKQYIERYLAFCHEECIVIGGILYDANETNPAYSLRLKYGKIREARTASQRRNYRYFHHKAIKKENRKEQNFATFNFLISKSIFHQVRFDEKLKGYGHEDMLFGHELHKRGFEFIQIENPLIHKGLDDNLTFIRKTEEATSNLLFLYQLKQYPFLAEESKLLATYLKLKKWHLVRLCAHTFELLKPILTKALITNDPSLFIYDVYKILYICKLTYNK